jgi:hypothetical protein
MRPTPILAWLGRGAPGRCRCDWRNEAGSQLGGSAPLPSSLGRSGRTSRCCHEFAVVTRATVCPPPSRPRCSGAQPPPHPLWSCRGLPEAQSMGDACGPSVVMKAAVWGGGEGRVWHDDEPSSVGTSNWSKRVEREEQRGRRGGFLGSTKEMFPDGPPPLRPP